MSDQSAWKMERRARHAKKTGSITEKTHTTLAQTSWQSPFLLDFQQPAR
jgi:hypothetical protein